MPYPEGGTKDGIYGAADHDQPYQFGRLPKVRAPFPFSTRQLARLLAYRSEIDNATIRGDDATPTETCLDSSFLPHREIFKTNSANGVNLCE